MAESRDLRLAGVHCCIAGCGPAGAMLGLLLARAGLDVVVLEKHGDFLRDFRGDTIHPSTLEILNDLGLADRFLELPHTRAEVMQLRLLNGATINIDFRRLPTGFPFIAFVPQWDFLNFVTTEATRYPGFRLKLNAEVLGLILEDGVIRGLRYRDPDGEQEIRAGLTVGADGRGSETRAAAGLASITTSAPMDVWWFRLTRRPDDPADVSLRVDPGHLVAFFNRGDYWQIAYTIRKGSDERGRADGIATLRDSVAKLIPEVADRVAELDDWDKVKLLTVRSDRLKRWYRPGYLAIGDAAHAMSPVGGVGINLAIQDAVMTANILWKPLRDGEVTVRRLAEVQRARVPSVRLVQGLQSVIQNALLKPALTSQRPFQIPLPIRALMRLPLVRDLPARVMAYGISRPRVRVPNAFPS